MKLKPNRNSAIDFLRAVATLLIVVTHVFQYHLGGLPAGRQVVINTFIWDYSHFAVVLFVFCSVSVLLPSYEHMEHTVASITLWYKKRVKRLLVPFYWYLVAHALLILTLPVVFTGNGLRLDAHFLFDSITLMNGINFNWLVLLFIQIALMFPLIHRISKRRVLSIMWGIGSFLFILSTFFLPQLKEYSRALMPIGWSLIVLLCIVIEQQKLKPFYVFLCSTAAFVTFVLLFPNVGSLISHKYPPDLFYLSYATMMSMVMIYVSKARVWENSHLKGAYTFISSNSYQIFFIHYIVLDASLRLDMNVGVHFIVVLATTLGITYTLNSLLHSKLV